MHGEGAADFVHKAIDLKLALPQGSAEFRVIGGTLYLKIPTNAGGASSKPWKKIDLVELKKAGSSTSSSFFTDDPTTMLTQLRGVSKKVTTVGTDTIDSAATTHYRAVVDLAAAAEKSGNSSARVQQLEKRLGTDTATVDVWIDQQNRVRQFRETVPMKPASGASGKAVVTLDLSDFGTPVHVTAPPANDVQDVTSRAASHS